MGRLISNILAHGLSPDIIIQQLNGISSTPVISNGRIVKSIPDAISLAFMMNSDLSAKDVRPEGGASGRLCPICGYSLVFQEGCLTCVNCNGKVGCS